LKYFEKFVDLFDSTPQVETIIVITKIQYNNPTIDTIHIFDSHHEFISNPIGYIITPPQFYLIKRTLEIKNPKHKYLGENACSILIRIILSFLALSIQCTLFNQKLR